MTVNERYAADFLSRVAKPARYTGGEVNAVVKEVAPGMTRFAFCFPDVYEVGMSHLGLQILYFMLNRRADTYCERCFMPWLDMLALMREHEIPLSALERGNFLPWVTMKLSRSCRWCRRKGIGWRRNRRRNFGRKPCRRPCTASYCCRCDCT